MGEFGDSASWYWTKNGSLTMERNESRGPPSSCGRDGEAWSSCGFTAAMAASSSRSGGVGRPGVGSGFWRGARRGGGWKARLPVLLKPATLPPPALDAASDEMADDECTECRPGRMGAAAEERAIEFSEVLEAESVSDGTPEGGRRYVAAVDAAADIEGGPTAIADGVAPGAMAEEL